MSTALTSSAAENDILDTTEAVRPSEALPRPECEALKEMHVGHTRSPSLPWPTDRAGNDRTERNLAAILSFTAVAAQTEHRGGVFHALSSWEGVVLTRDGDSFTARLTDPEGRRGDEEAEFPIDEIPLFDRNLVNPGAVFYWTIGYWDSIAGLRSRVSQIRFRRLPVWGSKELAQSKANAARLSQLFD